jgi:spermidine/putrescine transport system substrate-binding protein
MFEHPKNRRPGMTRREFLRRAGAMGIAVPGMAAILAACANDNGGGSGGGGGGSPALQLARPDNPVTLPITDQNPAIADGLQPESGPLKIYGYADYIWKKDRNRFSDKYGVDIEYTSFETPEEMIAKMQAQGSSFDLLVTITLENVGKMATGALIQPLNHSYLPNFAANAWDAVKSPFYDQGSRYTVPYAAFSTGIVYRNDVVKEDIAELDNPYDALWDEKYAAQGVHLLNGARDTLSAAQLRAGIDVNTTSTDDLDTVSRMLLDGVKTMNWKFDHVDYNELNNQFVIHQTWSGQVTYYQYYLPKGISIDQFTWVWPPTTPSKKPGLISNDCFAIPKGCQNPVLAHAMIDFLYDPDIAMENYSYEGYQPPIKQFDPDKVVADGIVPESLRNSLLSESDFPMGSDPTKVIELELPPEVNQRYEQIYQQVTGGV